MVKDGYKNRFAFCGPHHLPVQKNRIHENYFCNRPPDQNNRSGKNIMIDHGNGHGNEQKSDIFFIKNTKSEIFICKNTKSNIFLRKNVKKYIFLCKNLDLQLQQQRCDHHMTSSYDIII